MTGQESRSPKPWYGSLTLVGAVSMSVAVLGITTLVPTPD